MTTIQERIEETKQELQAATDEYQRDALAGSPDRSRVNALKAQLVALQAEQAAARDVPYQDEIAQLEARIASLEKDLSSGRYPNSEKVLRNDINRSKSRLETVRFYADQYARGQGSADNVRLALLGKTVNPPSAEPVRPAPTEPEAFIVKTAEGRKVYTPNTPEGRAWAAERFGVDWSLKAGQYTVTDVTTGKTYTGQNERIRGKDYFVGIRPVDEVASSAVAAPLVSEERRKDYFDLSGQDIGALPRADISVQAPAPASKKVLSGSIGLPSSPLNERYGPVEKGLSAVGLIRGENEYYNPSKTRLGVSELKEGVLDVPRGIVADPVGAVASGVAVGAVASTGVGLPAALGIVFTGQNVLEAASGEETSIQRIAEQPPARTAGQVAGTFALAEGSKLAVGAIQGVRFELKSAEFTRRYGGELVTRDAQQGLASPPGKDVSTQIQVRPLLYEWQQAMSQDRAGARVTVGSRQRILGEPSFMSSEELARQPTNFIFKADIERGVQVRPASGEPAGQFGVSTVSQEVVGRYTVKGLISSEELAHTSEPVVRVDVRPGSEPSMVREAVGTARVEFFPVEISSARDLAVRPSGGGARPSAPLRLEQGNLLEYRPALDYWRPVLEADGPGGRFGVTQSLATGEQRLTTSPLVIEKVSLKPGPSSGLTAAPGKGGVVSVRETEVDAPSKGGQVLKQKVKVLDISVPEVKTEQQAVAVKEPQAVAVQQSKVSEKPRFRVSGGRTLSEIYGRRSVGKARRSSGTTIFSIASTAQGAGQSSFDSISSQSQSQGAASSAVSFSMTGVGVAGASQSASSMSTTKQMSRVETANAFSGARLPETSIPEVTTLPRGEKKKESRLGGPGFNVEVRRRGKFSRVNTRPLSLGEASAQGQAVAQKTAAASFRVVRVGDSRPTQLGAGIPSTFTESKRERGVYVQKNRFRISSPGEKSEITFKGVAANRGQSLFRRRKKLFRR